MSVWVPRTGDEEVAATLEAYARRAGLPVAHASAATAFLRPAELSKSNSRDYGLVMRPVLRLSQVRTDEGAKDAACCASRPASRDSFNGLG